MAELLSSAMAFHFGAKTRLRRFLVMAYLQSTALETVVYDERARALRAKFRGDGKVMIYENVPQEIYDSLIFADSISTYFRDHIEGAFLAHEDNQEARPR